MKKWQLSPRCTAALDKRLARSLGISTLLASLLIQRGYRDPEVARRFLEPDLNDLHSPFAFRSMALAVKRLQRAKCCGERVGIFGDYDVDGITSTALLTLALRERGWDVVYRLPERLSEGYGLNQAGLADLMRQGARVIVTVDCGIKNHEEIAGAQNQGVDVIVCDHHLPGSTVPSALAVIDPQLTTEEYPFKELAGVGVTLKLVQALTGELDPRWLELAALGTVADVAPLVGENRVLVAHGLKALQKTEFPGLRALFSLAGLDSEDLSTGQISFRVAPRLNALGRLGSAVPGVELFLTRDSDEASLLAEALEAENRRRQDIEAQVLAEATDQVERESNLEQDMALIVAGEGWHPGVIGIVAARLVESWQRPALVIAWDGEIGKGSGRSTPAFSLYDGLQKADRYLLTYGGHPLAAGFSLRRENLPAFKERFLTIAAAELTPEDLIPCQRIDAEVALADLTPEVVTELTLLAPFGRANPEPVLLARGLNVKSVRAVGQTQDHLRLDLVQGSTRMGGIGFGLGKLVPELAGKALDIAFHPFKQEWQGEERVELKVRDVRTPERAIKLSCYAPEDKAPVVVDLRNMNVADSTNSVSSQELVILGEPPLDPALVPELLRGLSPSGSVYLVFGEKELTARREAVQASFPDWEFLARLYLRIKSAGEGGISSVGLTKMVMPARSEALRNGLLILEELGLVGKERYSSETINFIVKPWTAGHKISLLASRRFRQLEKKRIQSLSFLDFLEQSPAPVLAAFFGRMWLKSREMTNKRVIC